jgi:hypothetical protein
MTKSKITQVVQTGTSTWKDKNLTKYLIVFENTENGTYTTGFNDTDKAPVVGDEMEYSIVDNGFGAEVKVARAGGGGGFKAKAWTPKQVATQNAIKVLCSAIEGGLDLKHYQKFYIDCFEFMMTMENNEETAKPVVEGTVEENDDLPF